MSAAAGIGIVATALTPHVVAVSGRLSLADDAGLEIRTLSYPAGAEDSEAAQVLLVRGPDRDPRAALPHAVTDLRAFARAGLAALDSAARATVMRFLVSALDWEMSAADSAELAASLMALREALRERLPCCGTTWSGTRALHIQALAAVDERTFWVNGWMHDREAPVASLMAVSPEGARVELIERVARSGDDRVELMGSFELPVRSVLREGWTFEMRNAAGLGHEARGPRAIVDAAAAIRTIVEPLAADMPADAFMREHVVPAVTRLLERQRRNAGAARAVQLGRPAVSPSLTVIVALAGGLDPLEHHLAALVDDAEAREVDLVYVAPSADGDRWIDRADQLFALYRVPFRLLTLEADAGFAGAIDTGLAAARGDLVLVLDPDVLPPRADWLRRIEIAYRSTPGVGALDMTLLNVDGTVREVPAAGGVLIDRDLLWQLGALSGRLLERDAELADLRARVLAEGRGHTTCLAVRACYLGDEAEAGARPRAETRYDAWVRLNRRSFPASTAAAARRRTGSAT